MVVVRLAPGPGTYVRRGHVVSSVVGTVRATPRRRRPPPDDDDDEDDAGGLGGVVAAEGAIEGESWTISVVPERRRPASSSSSSSSYGKRPTVGSVVLGRVTRVSRPSHASVDIVASVPEGGGGGGGGGGERGRSCRTASRTPARSGRARCVPNPPRTCGSRNASVPGT